MLKNGLILVTAMGTLITVPAVAQTETTVNEASRPDSQPEVAQVEQISQFGDVFSNHWAFEALQNLVEDYDCIEGYPDRTYRGDRALTRYEFAAGLNSCFQQLQRSEDEVEIEPTVRSPVVIPVDEPNFEQPTNLSDVFNRAFFKNSGDFYDAITIGSQLNSTIGSQLNSLLGFKSFPEGSYPENEIADDAQLLNYLLQDALAHQVRSAPPLRTPDLENPFGTSLFQNPAYSPSVDEK